MPVLEPGRTTSKRRGPTTSTPSTPTPPTVGRSGRTYLGAAVTASATRRNRARMGVVGLSGYGGDICNLLRKEDEQPLARTRLSGVFAHDAENHGERIAELRAVGVEIFPSYDALLTSETIDGVWLPVPIHLHRSMAERALKAGVPLMLEKPVAGSVADHLALLQLQEQTGIPVLIGFQDIYAPGTAHLKRLLLDGRYGQPLRAVVHGCWPRPDAYYNRNDWAGALTRNGVAVSDSPLSNAMAHFVNLALFLLGPSFDEAADVRSVQSELWRVRPIENFDTCSLRVHLQANDGPLDLVVLLTHATNENSDPTVEIDTDQGTLRWRIDGRAAFRANGSNTETELVAPDRPRPHMCRQLGALICEGADAISSGSAPNASSTLSNSLSHTLLFEAARLATDVTEVPAALQEIPEDPRSRARSVRGLASAIAKAAAARRTLLENGTDLPGKAGTFDDVPALLKAASAKAD